MSGKLILQSDEIENKNSIDLLGVPARVYTVSLIDENNILRRKLLVVK